MWLSVGELCLSPEVGEHTAFWRFGSGNGASGEGGVGCSVVFRWRGISRLSVVGKRRLHDS